MAEKKIPKKPELIEIPAKTRHEILNIPKQHLRVCAYCRVSTDTEEQESSYESQLQFYTSHIRNMLSNEKYIGNCLIQKTFSTDFLSPRRKNNGEATQWLLKGNHEPIITQQQFDHVQELLQTEKTRPKNNISFLYPLSTIITCKQCGRNYNRSGISPTGKHEIIWICFGRAKLKNCKNRILTENEVYDAYHKLFPNQQIRSLRNKIERIYVDGNELTFITVDGEEKKYMLSNRGYRK